MSKILGSWSGMRKYLEQEMLAPSLRGRIRYGCTAYVGMDGCHIFELCVDDLSVKRFSWETVNTYFIVNGFTKNRDPRGIAEYWAEYQSLLERYPMRTRSEYTDNEFCGALEIYRNQPIKASLQSDDPLVRMFAVLDRRVGKRTLRRLRETLDEQPDWLRALYELRLNAEGV